MKAPFILLGVATAGAVLLMARRRKNRPLTFTEKAARMGGRLMALGAIAGHAVKTEAESMARNFRDAKKQSVRAWNSEPRLSFKLK